MNDLSFEKFDNLKNDRLPVTLDDLENMWNEDRNNYNNTNKIANGQKIVTQVNIRNQTSGSSSPSSKNRPTSRREQLLRPSSGGGNRKSLMRHKIRPNSVQNGYHHPESSAARIAKQIDDDMFNKVEFSERKDPITKITNVA